MTYQCLSFKIDLFNNVFSCIFYIKIYLLYWLHLKGHSSQWKIHSINLHMYNILVVHSNGTPRLLINN